VEKYEGRRPPSLDLFLEFIGLNESEFMEIAMSHAVSPYRHDMSRVMPGNTMHDFDQWDRHGAMARQEAKLQLDRWRRRNAFNHKLTIG